MRFVSALIIHQSVLPPSRLVELEVYSLSILYPPLDSLPIPREQVASAKLDLYTTRSALELQKQKVN